MGSIPEVQGVMEVTPYSRIRNLVVWGRRAAKRCCLPIFWVQKEQKHQINNQREGGGVCGVRGTARGHRSDPSRPPSRVDQAAAPDGFRWPKHPPGVQSSTKKGSHNNQQVVEVVWEQQEDAR